MTGPKSRTKLTARRAKPRGRLTPRDHLLLAFIEKAQPVTTRQVCTYLDLSRSMAARRLRVLLDHGLVTVHVERLDAHNIYTLSRKGRQTLARVFGGDVEDYRAMRGISRVSAEHHGGQVDLYAALARGCAQLGLVDLEAFLFERDIRAKLGVGETGGRLIPDASARLVHRDGRRFAVAIEIDCATEPVSWFAERKALGFCDLRAAGRPLMGCADWCVLVVAPSIRRRNRLLKACWMAGMDPDVLFFTTAEAVTPETVLTPVWVTPRPGDAGARARLVQVSPFRPVLTGGAYDPSQPLRRGCGEKSL